MHSIKKQSQLRKQNESVENKKREIKESKDRISFKRKMVVRSVPSNGSI